MIFLNLIGRFYLLRGKIAVYLGRFLAVFIAGILTAHADEAHVKPITDYVVANIKPWIDNPVLIEAVKTQNLVHAKITNVEIDKRDIAWTERSDQVLINSVMQNDLSKLLTSKKDAADGTIFEIFVFDSKGLNVGATNLTQDYMQGDEAKYWKTFAAGPDAIFVDKIAKDGGKNVSQASLTIKDPSTGAAIGAMTVGIDVDRLRQEKK